MEEKVRLTDTRLLEEQGAGLLQKEHADLLQDRLQKLEATTLESSHNLKQLQAENCKLSSELKCAKVRIQKAILWPFCPVRHEADFEMHGKDMLECEMSSRKVLDDCNMRNEKKSLILAEDIKLKSAECKNLNIVMEQQERELEGLRSRKVVLTFLIVSRIKIIKLMI